MGKVQVKSVIKFTTDMDKLIAKFEKNIDFLETIIINCVPPDEDLKVFYDKLISLQTMLKSIVVDIKIDNAKTNDNLKDVW